MIISMSEFPEIQAEIAQRVTFATQQNDIPVIHRLIVRNDTEQSFDNLELEITSEPQILKGKNWSIDHLSANSEIPIQKRETSLEVGFLHGLTEAMKSSIKFTLKQGEKKIAEYMCEITALARNYWGGHNHMPELLAAFITPNDPFVARLLKEASNILMDNKIDASINGYESKSRKRVWQLANAIWAAVSSRKIAYALPPTSFEREGQKVRLPSDIEQQGLSTCLDTTLLFAATLECAGLHPVVVLVEGHALAGVWLQKQSFPSMTIEDAMNLRKPIAQNEIIVFETTLATQNHPVSFSQAIEQGASIISEEYEDKFIYAIDIAHARSRNIRPLSLVHENPENTPEAPPIETGPTGLDEPPELPPVDMGVVEMQAEVPTAPADRWERWKRALLDLSMRNRMLNVKESRTAIPIFCHDPAKLEDLLAGGERIQLIPAPDSDGEFRRLRTDRSRDKQVAKIAFEDNKLVANINESSLQKSAITLYRKARFDMEEGGSNTLFLVLGMLRWCQSDCPGTKYRAPLILLPVQLARENARSSLYLKTYGEPAFNLTLKEMLRQDFSIDNDDIRTLAEVLPTDDSGVDVKKIWNIMRESVREVGGLEVVEDVMLSTLSFAKYLMWKDLEEHAEELEKSKFVHHLRHTPQEQYDYNAEILEPRQVDERIEPKDLLAPLNADSSQIVAIDASAKGGDFVLEGPPGTGKSETIGNIIAHNIGHGRKVLFVSEKMAALRAVYQRLAQCDLGDFCLELHSHKANKKEVVKKLYQSLQRRLKECEERLGKAQSGYADRAEQLKKERDDLNDFIKILHKPGPAGISAYTAIGRVSRYGGEHSLDLDWPSGDININHASSPEALEKLKTIAQSLVNAFQSLQLGDLQNFTDFAFTDWAHAWQREAVSHAVALGEKVDAYQEARNTFAKRIGIPILGQTEEEAKAFVALARLIPKMANRDITFACTSDAKNNVEQVTAAMTALKKYNQIKSGLVVSYPDKQINDAQIIDNFIVAREQAATKIWPLKIWENLKLRNSIRNHFNLSKQVAPKPDADLDSLRQMAECQNRMSLMPPNATSVWLGLNTDTEEMQATVELGSRMYDITKDFAQAGHQLTDIRSALFRVFVEEREMLEHSTLEAGSALCVAKDEFDELFGRFKEQALYEGEVEDLAMLKKIVVYVSEHQEQLRYWARWVKAKQEACEHGLDALVEALLSGEISPEEPVVEALITAYCRWVAPLLIDNQDILNKFIADDHERKIDIFCKLDKELARLVIEQVRAKFSEKVSEEISKESYALLIRQNQIQRRHMPVRKLIGEMGVESLTNLTPCLMMSPLSVAQFLPAGQVFDIVVFDEASQITVPDSIGAIARGKSCIIVGDPKQMPPTRFFERGQEGEEDDVLPDLESILDEALTSSMRHHRLTGHYRSRHESLICFSNHTYYENQLITYPAADTKESVVSFNKIDGNYTRGHCTNKKEAKAIVKEVIRRLNDPDLQKSSIGIVTLNSQQQQLIESLLDDERRNNPALEHFFGADVPEPVFVKNLETVQGDQRDIILIGLTYGPAEGSKTMSMNFGPLNRQGGERRLNVAVTRAKTEVVIFSSFNPGMIDLSRTSARAIQDLKTYLEFANRGPCVFGELIHTDGGQYTYDSDFEEAVASGLRERGWEVLTQIGVSKFRIDLGVIHPNAPGRYLAGVECDGATYHSSLSARDRDRIRQIILEDLGWRIFRVWSTEFFHNPEAQMDQLHKRLEEALLEDQR